MLCRRSSMPGLIQPILFRHLCYSMFSRAASSKASGRRDGFRKGKSKRNSTVDVTRLLERLSTGDGGATQNVQSNNSAYKSKTQVNTSETSVNRQKSPSAGEMQMKYVAELDSKVYTKDNNRRASGRERDQGAASSFSNKEYNVFKGGILGIFPKATATPTAAAPAFHSLHESDWQNQLKSVLEKLEPQNGLEYEIEQQHTSWSFPIDNDEKHSDQTTFTEHTFLPYDPAEFPDNVQVQQFMELVILGLQKNPHLSVNEKESRIDWFRSYFASMSTSDLSEAE